jgi:hypothetical protein
MTNTNVGFSLTGQINRTAMAAALGVALSLVGGLAWASSFLRSQQARTLSFCVLVSLFAASGILINNTIASFWVSAYREQQQILADIRQTFPALPVGTTFILDGVCPYVGPGSVFEAPYDLAGALGIHYQDAALRADVVRPNLEIREEGLATSYYGRDHLYSYGRLLIYNVQYKVSSQLTDREAAESYFRRFNPDWGHACPGTGPEGYGVRIF